MPTYEYKCNACGHKFEKFQPITAAAIKRCPTCGKNKVQRLIGTGAGLIFKGSGFYITDYRSDSYKEKAKAESGGSDAKPADAKSGDAKSADAGAAKDAKPSARTDAAPAAQPESKSKSDSKPAQPRKNR